MRLLWGLYVEHEWIPGAERLLAPASGELRGAAYHQHNKARLAAKHLMEQLFPADELAEVAT